MSNSSIEARLDEARERVVAQRHILLRHIELAAEHVKRNQFGPADDYLYRAHDVIRRLHESIRAVKELKAAQPDPEDGDEVTLW